MFETLLEPLVLSPSLCGAELSHIEETLIFMQVIKGLMKWKMYFASFIPVSLLILFDADLYPDVVKMLHFPSNSFILHPIKIVIRLTS